MKEHGEDANNEASGCVVSPPLSCNFGSCDDLVTKFQFSWQGFAAREE